MPWMAVICSGLASIPLRVTKLPRNLPEGLVIEQAFTLDFKATNNEAEYEAMIAGLNSARILGAQHLEIFSDSQLVTSQLAGDYQARDDRMAAYLALAKKLLSQF